MPVSLYGQCAEMEAINAIAERHGGIPVIEDAAQSFGAVYRNGRSCNVSTIGCTSFFPSKPLGCYGDGGAIFTSDAELAQIMREIRVHGQSKRYQHDRIGVGGRLDTLQAAVLLAKMDVFDDEVAARVALGERYRALLAPISGVDLIAVDPDCASVWGQFTVMVEERDRVTGELGSAGIPTAVHYPIPLHNQKAYVGLCRISGSLAESERAARRVFSLPMHPYLTDEQQVSIVDAVRTAVVGSAEP